MTWWTNTQAHTQSNIARGVRERNHIHHHHPTIYTIAQWWSPPTIRRRSQQASRHFMNRFTLHFTIREIGGVNAKYNIAWNMHTHTLLFAGRVAVVVVMVRQRCHHRRRRHLYREILVMLLCGCYVYAYMCLLVCAQQHGHVKYSRSIKHKIGKPTKKITSLFFC